MSCFGRTESKRWWREGEYIPKNSRWLLESLQGVYGTVESMVKMIEEEEEEEEEGTKTHADRAEMRDHLMGKVKEMCKAYFELVEQHDRLVGANHTDNKDFSELPNQPKPSPPSVNGDAETGDEMHFLKENEIEDALTNHNALAQRLHNVVSELSKTQIDLAKKEEMLFTVEKLNYQQKSNLDSLQQKVQLQEKELKQKREETKKMKIQNASYEEKMNNLLKDISLLNKEKKSLEKEVELHLRDKEKLYSDLSSQIEVASKVNTVHEEALMKYKVEKETLSEKNLVLEKTLFETNIELEVLSEKVLELESDTEVLTQKFNEYLKKKKNSLEVLVSNLKTEPQFSETKSNDKEGSSKKLISIMEKISTQVHFLKEQIKKLNEMLHEAETSIGTPNRELFEQPASSKVATYDFLIRMRIWREVNDFLSKIPIWRKIRDRVEISIEGLKEGLGDVLIWLSLFSGNFLRYSGTIKYHLVKYFCSIRTILHFYVSFFAARFSCKQGANEIPKSQNEEAKGVREVGEVESMQQLEIEMQENELPRQKLLNKRE